VALRGELGALVVLSVLRVCGQERRSTRRIWWGRFDAGYDDVSHWRVNQAPPRLKASKSNVSTLAETTYTFELSNIIGIYKSRYG
jgi:hypothetical protein